MASSSPRQRCPSGEARKSASRLLALLERDLLETIAEGEALREELQAGVDQRAQRSHVVVDRRVEGVVEDVECRLDARACLGGIEIFDLESDSGALSEELVAYRTQGAGHERVLD